MAKQAPDDTLDAALDYIAGSTVMHVLSGYSADDSYATVVAASLADVAIDATDFVEGAGDVSGRKLTVAAQNGVPVDVAGAATHIALVKSADSTVRYVTTCTLQEVTLAASLNLPAWDIEIRDPT